jgi:membrane-associated phospholipid phosphatase
VLTIIRQNRIYFNCLGLYFFFAGLMVWMQEKGTAVLFFNKNYHPLFNLFFKIITYLGDGLFAVPFIIVLILFRNIFLGIIMTISMLLSLVVIQVLKHYVFPNSPRPARYFPESFKLNFVEGVEIHSQNSFPSGHSAQAFVIFLLLALFTKNKNLGYFYFIMAVMVTISRMYLAQHFLIDTYFGALIATVITLFTYTYFVNHSNLSKKERLQKGWLL